MMGAPRVVVLAGLLAGAPVCLPAAVAAAQQRAVRFEITAVSDTTLTFRTGTATWVAPGRSGSALDPRRRDQLVARFRVLYVRGGLATALVTGQTTSVSTDHVATMQEPARPWFKATTFWTGMLIGGALGASAVLVK